MVKFAMMHKITLDSSYKNHFKPVSCFEINVNKIIIELEINQELEQGIKQVIDAIEEHLIH